MKHSNTIREGDVILWINIVFAGIASLLLFYYVMMANVVSAENYRIQTLRDKIELLAETNGDLMNQKLLLENPNVLFEFAKSHGLVEAKNISYIFENKNVAQR
ncbi:MAG: hypothetical protein HYT62_03060 [Candidatus Yanofskybacteria bacterium]|nr:hypothetical protein [Candidatus Yanofskybacteria bacterium]